MRLIIASRWPVAWYLSLSKRIGHISPSLSNGSLIEHTAALVRVLLSDATIWLICYWIIESWSVEFLSLLMIWSLLLMVLEVRIIESIRFSEHHNLIVTFILVLTSGLVLRSPRNSTLWNISPCILPVVLVRRRNFTFWELAGYSTWRKVWSIRHILESLVGPISGIWILKTSWISDATLLVGLLDSRLWDGLALCNLCIVWVMTVIFATCNLNIILNLTTGLRWASGMSTSLGNWRSVSQWSLLNLSRVVMGCWLMIVTHVARMFFVVNNWLLVE